MRILLLSNLFPPEFVGGYELIALSLATHLALAGHEVVVATSPLINHHQDLPDQPYRIERCLKYVGLSYENTEEEQRVVRGSFIDMDNIAALQTLISAFAPDRVLLGNVAGLGSYGIVVLVHALGYQPVHYMADNIFSDCEKVPDAHASFRRLFNADEALANLDVLAVSSRILEETQASAGQTLGRVLFMPGWMEMSPEQTLSPGSEGFLRCVFSSRIAPHKGTLVLLDAVEILHNQGETGFFVDLYGGGQVPEFLQRAHAMGIGQYFRYHGALSRDEMQRDFARYDTLLFPTWEREPLGLVPFEAAAQGCIPIMTAAAGAAEWLIDNADCIKIERDSNGLAGAMQRLMYMPFQEREAMRRRVRTRIRSSFDISLWFPRIERFLLDAGRRTTLTDRQAKDVKVALFAITRIWKG
jgi:glycosyltransferase involved in cell wall biosynthesis